jgi:Zn ribbon nucleic-acid-binding protein
MPKCPRCPSVKFNIGKIAIGRNGSAEVVFCIRCGTIIPFSDKSLIKPRDENSQGSVTMAPMTGL